MTKRILYNTVIQNPFLMRMVGLEPTRSHLRKILSLVRLPFRHIRIMASFLKPRIIISLVFLYCKLFLLFYKLF